LAKLQSDLREFINLLNSHRVDYLIVGGHAVAFHGHPRYTGDIDVFVRATLENARLVLAVLSAFGFSALEIDAADLATPDKILQLGRPPNRIDILTSISGVTFEIALANSIVGELGDVPVRFISWDDLLANKRASGRAKDLSDVDQLMAVAKAKS
jgi:predicted nucleotidyltransferase